MLVLDTPLAFLDLVGQKLGTSSWFTITQAHISDFARLTGDDFWIHTDTERAAREMPGGKTIAHGLFTLSLVPLLQRDIFRIERRGRGLNYGSNKVRYTAPVPAGSRVRLHQTLLSAVRVAQATRIVTTCEFEIEGAGRPALVAEFILQLEDAPQ
jgi:acyl dehydratase